MHMQADGEDFLTESAQEERILEGNKAGVREIEGQRSLMQHVDCWILSDLTRKMDTSKAQRDADGRIQKIMVPAIRNNRTNKLIIKKKTIQNF